MATFEMVWRCTPADESCVLGQGQCKVGGHHGWEVQQEEQEGSGANPVQTATQV